MNLRRCSIRHHGCNHFVPPVEMRAANGQQLRVLLLRPFQTLFNGRVQHSAPPVRRRRQRRGGRESQGSSVSRVRSVDSLDAEMEATSRGNGNGHGGIDKISGTGNR